MSSIPPAEAGAGERRIRRSWLATVAPLVAYVALAVLVFAPEWRHPETTSIGVVGDSQQTMWFLRWTPYAISHHLNPFVTDYGNWPDGVNLMWNTSMPLLGLLLAPVTTTLGPVVAYNLLVTLGFALGAWVGFLAIRRWVGGTVGPAVGGLLYGFSPYMTAQASGHANLVVTLTPPLLLILLDELLVRDRRRDWVLGLWLGVLGTAQLLVSEEMLASEAIIAAAGVALLALLHRDLVAARARRALRGAAVGAVVFVLLSAWPLGVQFLGQEHVHGPEQIRNVYVSDLLGFVVPTGVFQLAPARALGVSANFTGNMAEIDNYVGLPLLALVAVASWRGWRRQDLRYFVILGLFTGLLSMGPRLHVDGRSLPVVLPWAAVDHIPLFDSVLPSRLMLYCFLFAGIVLAALVAEMTALRARPRALLGWALLLAAAVSILPKQPFFSATEPIPAYFTGGGIEAIPEGSVVLFGPYPGRFTVDPMLWVAEAGIHVRMRGGYFSHPDANGQGTNDYDTSATATAMVGIKDGTAHPSPTGDLRARIRAEWRAWGIACVIVGPEPAHDELIAFLTGILGTPPREQDGVEIWSDVERTVAAP